MDERIAAAVECITADDAKQDVKAYIEGLEKSLDITRAELEAKPGAEARGIAWTDMYKVVVIQAGNDNNQEPVYRNKVVKQSVTARSDAGPTQAYQALKIAVAAMMVDGWRPYSPV